MIKQLLFVFFCLGAQTVSAQDFVYYPKNPSFGGNQYNYTWLLNSANAQNTFSDPNQDDNFFGDPLTNFQDNLNRNLLNQLSQQIIDQQFGEQGLNEGSFQLGDYQVDVIPGLDGLSITVNDLANGGQTQLIIPYF